MRTRSTWRHCPRRRPRVWSPPCWMRRCCPVELQQPILDRAEGNPLYAEEFVRLLKDRDLLERAGSSWQLREGAEVPFPDSVQALIAARLDTLEPDAKSLLADAAVIGKVFWAGAVAAMGDRDPQTVTATLRELSRKELVRSARQSSMEGEAEYAFWHILARDVAYAQLPAGLPRHRGMSQPPSWIESKAPERVEDLADVLAYHYATALGARPAPPDKPTRQPSWKHRRCGSSASRANAPSGSTPPRPSRASSGHSRSPHQDTRNGPPRSPASARPRAQAGRYGEATEALEEAVGLLRDGGRPRAAAQAMGTLAIVLVPARGSARPGTLPARGGRAARAARARPGARRRAHRARPCREPAGPPRGRHRLCGAGARPGRGARAREARPRPRLPRNGSRQPRRPGRHR